MNCLSGMRGGEGLPGAWLQAGSERCTGTQRGWCAEEGCIIFELLAHQIVGPGLRIQLRGQIYFLHCFAAAGAGI